MEKKRNQARKLGHNEYITDKSGRPYQYFHYSAFGEVLVQRDANYGSFQTSYTFNAKEFDAETGLGYYGARYYNPTFSVWLGVDPLAFKYPSMSPYVFTGNNPIRFVDPNGKEIDPEGKEEKQFLKTWVKINFGEDSGIKIKNNSVRINDKKFNAAFEKMDQPTKELAMAFRQVVNDSRTVKFKLGEDMTITNSVRTGNYLEQNVADKMILVPQVLERQDYYEAAYAKSIFLGDALYSLDNHGILINPTNHYEENGALENKYASFSHEIGHLSLFFEGVDKGDSEHQSRPINFENVTRLKLGLTIRKGILHGH